MSIQIRNINKTFKNFRALNDISLEIPTGKLVAILGPSGCGKTTLLRIVAGLEAPDPTPGADIVFDGISAAGSPVNRRQVGFVFQHYALFRQMTVARNARSDCGSSRAGRAARERFAGVTIAGTVQFRAGDRYPDQFVRRRCHGWRWPGAAIRSEILWLDEPSARRRPGGPRCAVG